MTEQPIITKPLRASNHCRHYSYRNTGLAGFRRGDHGGPQCAVGCDQSGGVDKCMPDRRPESVCDQREEYTEAERAEWKEYVSLSLERMAIISQHIPGASNDRKKRDHWGSSGSFSRPACKTGTVRWARASNNGHLHAACSTPNCFAVMQ